MTPDPLTVAALLYDGFYAFEFQLAAEVFGLERPELGPDWYRFITCAEADQAIARDGKIRILADLGLCGLEGAGTIIVPGWPPDKHPDAMLATALLAAHKNGSRLVSVCSGAFLLAELGLLDGRRATTHWRYADIFRQRFPGVALDPNVLYVDEGDVMTSAGSAAGLDLLLHLIRKDKGVAAANSVARRLVLPPHREGGQLQFVEAPVARAREKALAELLDTVRADPAAAWPLDKMAAHSAMSPRTLSRRFQDATGLSPGAWLTRERIRLAKAMLEGSAASIADIAAACGLGSPHNLVRRFKTQVGVSPSAYRRSFSKTGQTEESRRAAST